MLIFVEPRLDELVECLEQALGEGFRHTASEPTDYVNFYQVAGFPFPEKLAPAPSRVISRALPTDRTG